MTDAAQRYEEHAERARESFNRTLLVRGRRISLRCRRLQRRQGTHDPSCRPNQIFAISLDHPVLDAGALGIGGRCRAERELLTPVGLRSLSPDDPDYKPIYAGDLRSRDGAYHQGTVWAWLIGPFIDAWLKVHPDDKDGARKFLERFPDHLNDDGHRHDQRSLRRARTAHWPAAASRRRGAWRKCCAAG